MVSPDSRSLVFGQILLLILDLKSRKTGLCADRNCSRVAPGRYYVHTTFFAVNKVDRAILPYMYVVHIRLPENSKSPKIATPTPPTQKGGPLLCSVTVFKVILASHEDCLPLFCCCCCCLCFLLFYRGPFMVSSKQRWQQRHERNEMTKKDKTVSMKLRQQRKVRSLD